MRSAETSLVFGEDHNPKQGFTNLSANRDQVKDDIVVRELIQNALDAGQGKRSVRFLLIDTLRDDIPHIAEYIQAFNSAREHCIDGEPSTGKQVIHRIDEALVPADHRVPCLVCSDDGAGIGESELRSLYSSGRSTKLTSGRGSVGHGHLTAFAPSDLRYVLYAGRCEAMTETFGGHALVATHIVQDSDGREIQKSADGFIRENRLDGQRVLFDSERGGKTIPEPLKGYVPRARGSAVMIVGYRPLSDIDAAELIVSASARHFLVAIFDETLTVSLQTGAGQSVHSKLNRKALRKCFVAMASQRDKKASLRMLSTLEAIGSQLPEEDTAPLGTGVRIWLRSPLADDETSKRVSIFRDGMWIENNNSRFLAPRHFPGVQPFDAVVDLSSETEGSFGWLVREAEGASHLQIKPKEIADGDLRRQLTDKMKALRDVISENALRADDAEDYAPPQLRLLGASAKITAPPRRRPPRYEPDLEDPTPVPDEKPLPEGPPSPAPPTPDPHPPEPVPQPRGDRDETEKTVKAGNSSGLSTSCRPDLGNAGVFYVSWNAADGKFHGGNAELRMILPSGTDQTSRHKIAPEHLRITSATFAGRKIKPSRDRPKELRLTRPPASGSVVVQVDVERVQTLDAMDLGLVEAELVHRSSGSPTGESV